MERKGNRERGRKRTAGGVKIQRREERKEKEKEEGRG